MMPMNSDTLIFQGVKGVKAVHDADELRYSHLPEGQGGQGSSSSGNYLPGLTGRYGGGAVR